MSGTQAAVARRHWRRLSLCGEPVAPLGPTALADASRWKSIILDWLWASTANGRTSWVHLGIYALGGDDWVILKVLGRAFTCDQRVDEGGVMPRSGSKTIVCASMFAIGAGCATAPPPAPMQGGTREPPRYYECSASAESEFGRISGWRTVDLEGADYISVNDWRTLLISWNYAVNQWQSPGYTYRMSWFETGDRDALNESGWLSIYFRWTEELPRRYSLHFARGEERPIRRDVAMQTTLRGRQDHDRTGTHVNLSFGELRAFAQGAGPLTVRVLNKKGEAVQSMALDTSVLDSAVEAAREILAELDAKAAEYATACNLLEDYERIVVGADG